MKEIIARGFMLWSLFSPIFCENNGVFQNEQCYNHFICTNGWNLNQDRKLLSAKIFFNIGPWSEFFFVRNVVDSIHSWRRAQLLFILLTEAATENQSCQIIYFRTKNHNLGKCLNASDWKIWIYFYDTWNILQAFGIFNDHLVHSVFILVHFSGFGIMHQINLATLTET
jgi:hypothetical protein